MIIGELASFGAGSLRLRDSDVLVVRNTGVLLTKEQMVEMRETVEAELIRLGVFKPLVMVLPRNVSIEVIERS